jgi:hypothetical protein
MVNPTVLVPGVRVPARAVLDAEGFAHTLAWAAPVALLA